MTIVSKAVWVIFVSFSITSANVCAQQSGFYIGGSAGTSKLDFDFQGQVRSLSTPVLPISQASVTDSRGSGYKLTTGYQVYPKASLEVAWVDLGSYSIAYEYNGLGRFTRFGSYELDGVNVSVVFSEAIADRISLLAKAGVFHSRYKYSETGQNFPAFLPSTSPPTHSFVAPEMKSTRPSFGLGIDYKVNDYLSLRGEWDRYVNIGKPVNDNESSNGKFDAVDLFSIGAIWRF